MTERFQKAYDSLVRAFFEGTLAKWSCIACACGNIIFDAVGTPLTKEQFQDEIRRMSGNCSGNEWDQIEERLEPLLEKASDLWADKRIMGKHKFEAFDRFKDEVNAAGYTTQEFVEIENAFETKTRIKICDYNEHSEQEILEDQYNGLCAVVDVLLELDKDYEPKEELKQKFREHPKLKTV